MKKIIFFVIFLCSIIGVPIFAFQNISFQDRLYCNVSEKSVKVYLLQDGETAKCQDFLDTINIYLKVEYDSLLQVMINRNRGEDILYWNAIFQKKKEQFLKLFFQRQMIKKTMDEFEKEFLFKSQSLLESTLLKKLEELNKQIAAIQAEVTESEFPKIYNQVALDLQERKSVVEGLLFADNMTDFIEKFDRYLFLFPFDISGR